MRPASSYTQAARRRPGFRPASGPGTAPRGSRGGETVPDVGSGPRGRRYSTPMKLSVIGVGYLGAVHAATMASVGHDVVAVDSD